MMTKTDDLLKTLIERGKQTGSLTYEEVNAALPEGLVDPERLGDILEQLEQSGINVIDEADTEAEPGTADFARRDAGGRGIPVHDDNDGDGKHIDDPVRMYLTPDG